MTKEKSTNGSEKFFESHEFIKNVIKHSPTGISVYEKSGKCVYANDSIALMIGASKEQVLEQNFLEIESWKKTGLLDEAKNTFENNKSISMEFNSITTFGKKAYIDCNFIPFSSESEKFLMLILNDITELKETTISLEESEGKFKEIFEKSILGIALIDLEGRPTINNTSFQNMTGFSEKELSKFPFSTFIHPDDVGQQLHFFQELLEGKRESLQTECRFIRKDKEIIWVNVTVSVLRDEQGNPLYMIAMVEDISNRKETESLMKQSTITRDLVGAMFHDLKDIGGLTDRAVFLAGNLLSEGIEVDTLEDYLSSFKNMGLGELEIEEINLDKGRWVFSGRNLVELLIDSKKPTDNYALGYLCGAVSKISQFENVAGVEIECQSMSDEKCKFVIQKK